MEDIFVIINKYVIYSLRINIPSKTPSLLYFLKVFNLSNKYLTKWIHKRSALQRKIKY